MTESLPFHRQRFVRMLADLDLDVMSLRVDAAGAIVDEGRRRPLTPPLGNLTLAEGLISAIKLVAIDKLGFPDKLQDD